MDIYGRILNTKIDFYRITGKAPKNLYLGKKEYEEFKIWIKENIHMYVMDAEGRLSKNFSEIDGMRIIEVVPDTHLACS